MPIYFQVVFFLKVFFYQRRVSIVKPLDELIDQYNLKGKIYIVVCLNLV